MLCLGEGSRWDCCSSHIIAQSITIVDVCHACSRTSWPIRHVAEATRRSPRAARKPLLNKTPSRHSVSASKYVYADTSMQDDCESQSKQTESAVLRSWRSKDSMLLDDGPCTACKRITTYKADCARCEHLNRRLPGTLAGVDNNRSTRLALGHKSPLPFHACI